MNAISNHAAEIDDASIGNKITIHICNISTDFPSFYELELEIEDDCENIATRMNPVGCLLPM